MKKGYSRSGTQRCQCGECGATYTINPKQSAYPEETRENVYILTMVNRLPRQIIGREVSLDKAAQTIQSMVDRAPEAAMYCTDGYVGYMDVIYPGRHIRNTRDKSDTFTVEEVNADLRHYIPLLARRSRCFPQKLETLQAVMGVFVGSYNRFGRTKHKYRLSHPTGELPFTLVDFFVGAHLDTPHCKNSLTFSFV